MKTLAFALTLTAALFSQSHLTATEVEVRHAGHTAAPSAHSCVYHVEYFDCSCQRWHCYGTYTHKCDADRSAHLLKDRGYKVRIRLVH